VSPWELAARDAGAVVRYVGVRAGDCTLDLDELRAHLTERTRLVAVAAASNLVGTINPIREISTLAHAVGAQLFVDAVHFAPHRLIDVADWDCDYLSCSAYKFFGPHGVGVLWGKRELMEQDPVYKLRPATDSLPGRWETGTQNHEGIAGTFAAVEYLADVGRHHDPRAASRREALAAAFRAIESYERELAAYLLEGLTTLPDVQVWGITDPRRQAERVPTTAITHARLTPREIAERLGGEGISVWDGNYYAVAVTESLGLEPGGMVRIGLMHYNTRQEIDRLIDCLRALD